MGKLSLQSYVWKCVLGVEIVYVACLSYGSLFLAGKYNDLHQTLFETLPGFTWNTLGVLFGAIDVLIFAILFGIYMVWMHNSSLSRED